MLGVKSSLQKFLASFFAAFILSLGLASFSQASNLANTMDNWLDPDLKGKERLVFEVMKDLTQDIIKVIPPRAPGEDFGYTSQPATKFDWIVLCSIRGMKINSGSRVPVVDCGCGYGPMSILAVLAGGRVDAVDFKETVALANENIFKSTRKVIGYGAKEAGTYYRAFPQTLIAEEAPSWTKTSHDVAISRDVLHFFTEKDVRLFAKRIFENVNPDGALMVQADAPFIDEKVWAYHQGRQGNTLCPGLGIYSKKRGGQGLHVSEPVPFEEACGLRPGVVYSGIYSKEGAVTDKEGSFHNVKNMFTTQDLANIFQQAGFKLTIAFYMDAFGTMLTDGVQPKVGMPSKACAIFVKPIV